MGYDDRREIFERLDALERMVRSRHDERRGWGDARHHGGRERGECRHCGEEFEEKRVIDTIVRLVTEHVGRMMAEQARARDDGGGEKRIVDLIVGLVSEHVEEIVARELDRRFGRAEGRRPDDGPPHAPPAEPENR